MLQTLLLQTKPQERKHIQRSRTSPIRGMNPRHLYKRYRGQQCLQRVGVFSRPDRYLITERPFGLGPGSRCDVFGITRAVTLGFTFRGRSWLWLFLRLAAGLKIGQRRNKWEEKQVHASV